MNSIIYRPIAEKDFSDIKDIINSSFGLHRFFINSEVLDCFLIQYLYECLAEATYTCVAEKDNKVAGFIIGNSKNDSFMNGQEEYLNQAKIFKNKLIDYGNKYNVKMNDYDNLKEVYKELIKDYENSFDGILTLFITSEAYRGMGIGKKLFSDFLGYLKNFNAKSFYLYTDSKCSYGFYDRMGFNRLKNIDFSLQNKLCPIDTEVYLYNYLLQ